MTIRKKTAANKIVQPKKPAGTAILAPGMRAPAFSLPGMDGQIISLSSLKGKKIVLYFYPRDDTPGCTIEAQEFSALVPAYRKQNAVILGVSDDTVKSHCAFRDKFALTHQLLADTQKRAITAYGCRVKKSMYGKRYLGTLRATFVIDTKGAVAAVFPNVTPEGHAQEVLAAVKAAR